MKRHVAVMFCVMGLLGAACAGSLEDPSRFEQGIKNAEGDDDEGDVDAGTPPADDQDNADEEAPAGDGDGDAPADDDEPVAAGCDEAPALLEAKCGNVGCHADLQTAGDVDLITEPLDSRLAEQEGTCDSTFKVVVPGDAQASMLYLKLTAPPCGGKMPIGGTLTDDEIKCVENWINGL
jgi:hypothetical protein